MGRPAKVLSLFFLLSGCTFWEIDKCLDRGGRWDEAKQQCQFE
jgi:hypothetical protein